MFIAGEARLSAELSRIQSNFFPHAGGRNNRSSLAPEYSGPINRRDQRMNGMFCAKIVHRSFAGWQSAILDYLLGHALCRDRFPDARYDMIQIAARRSVIRGAHCHRSYSKRHADKYCGEKRNVFPYFHHGG
jgi:hypothetical protein